MMRRKWIWILGLSLTLLFIRQPERGFSQSITGTTGLLTIPTAEMSKDGELTFGTSLIHRKHIVLGQNDAEYHGMANFVTLGFLPFIEVSARLTRLLDSPNPQAIGDRMGSVRLRVLAEKQGLPSVILGGHDIVTSFGDDIPNNNFNALYLVTSKHFRLDPAINRLGLHLGYGVDWIAAENREFVGLFGGVSISPRSFLTLMLEYDTEKFNTGVRLSAFEHLELLIVLLDFDSLSGGINYKFRL